MLLPDTMLTARLELRRLRDADFAHLRSHYRDERAMATLGGVRTDDETRELLQGYLEHWDTHGFGWWAVHERASGGFIGRGGLRTVEILGRAEVEIGYAFVPEAWGHGFATELARESVRVAFDVLDRPQVVSFTLPTNAASRRVMDKAALRHQGEILHADQVHVLYVLPRQEWRPELPRGRSAP